MQIASYDPLDPGAIENPYPRFAELREQDPVHWHEGLGCWVVTRYDDCLAIAHDHSRFARDRRRVGIPLPESLASLQTLDPPEQLPARRVFMKALREVDSDAVRAGARQITRAALARCAQEDVVDFVPALANPLSLWVSCALLGVAEPQGTTFDADADAIVAGMDAGRDESAYASAADARLRLNAMIESWTRSPAEGGVLSHVSGQVADGDDQLALQVRNSVRVVFLSGYMALSSGIGLLLAALLQRPEVAHALRDPALLATGVDELVRFDSPVTGTTRFAAEDVTLRGKEIKRGDGVLTLYAAANRDPETFTRPDDLLLARNPNPHFGYSWGVHACIGKSLSKSLLEDLVAEIVAMPAPPRLVSRPVHRRTATLRGIAALPVTGGGDA